MYGNPSCCHSTSMLNMTNCHLLQNLRLWGETNLGSCQLCHHRNFTPFHILNGCNYSLQIRRYSWRHNQTLKTFTSGLMPFMDQANERECSPQDTGDIPTIAFCAADGTAYRNPAIPLPKKECTNILQKANDWEVLMDKEHNRLVVPVPVPIPVPATSPQLHFAL